MVGKYHKLRVTGIHSMYAKVHYWPPKGVLLSSTVDHIIFLLA